MIRTYDHWQLCLSLENFIAPWKCPWLKWILLKWKMCTTRNLLQKKNRNVTTSWYFIHFSVFLSIWIHRFGRVLIWVSHHLHFCKSHWAGPNLWVYQTKLDWMKHPGTLKHKRQHFQETRSLMPKCTTKNIQKWIVMIQTSSYLWQLDFAERPK